MALIDEIRRIASEKDSFNPALARRASLPVGTRRAPAIRVAELLSRTGSAGSGAVSTPGAGFRASTGNTGGSGGVQSLASMIGLPEPKIQNESSGGGTSAMGYVGKGFSGIIDAADTLGSGTRALLKEVTDLPGTGAMSPLLAPLQMLRSDEGRDGSFDLDDLYTNTRDNVRFQEVFDKVQDLPGPLPTITGFAGDIATDPLTYLTAGTVRAGVTGGKAVGRAAAAGPLDNALIAGGRRDLAETVVQEAAKRNIVDEGVGRLAAEAGQRGRGAFTTKGLARAGVDESLPKSLGLTSEFGYALKLPGRNTVRIKGTGRLAEASENFKGAMKSQLAATKSAAGFRRLFVGGSSALGQAERRMVDELVTGAPNAETAARGLAALKLAKADSYFWMTEATEKVGREIPELKKLSDQSAREITDAIEAGIDDGLSGRVAGWYDEVGKFLQDEGVDFDFRSNYVNHMLTDRAKRAIADGDRRLTTHGLNALSPFQRGRTFTAGENFLGETLKDGSVRELNEISNRVLGFDVFESDVRVLMGAYLEQAQEAYMRSRVWKQADNLGISREFDQVVDDAAVAAKKAELNPQLEAATQEELEAMRAANKARKTLLEQGATAAHEARQVAARQLVDAEEAVVAAGRKVRDLEGKITMVQGRLSAFEVAEKHWGQVLDAATKSGKKAAAAQKGKATRQIKALEEKIAAARSELDDLNSQLAKASDPAVQEQLKGNVAAARIQFESGVQNLDAAQAARAAMDDPDLPVPHTAVPAEKLAEASENVARVREEFLSLTSEYGDAANAFVWMRADSDTAVSALSNRLDKFDVVAEAKKGAKVGRSADEVRAARTELRDRSRLVLRTFSDLGDDPQLNVLRNIEAQAASHDMTAFKASMSQADIQKQLDALDDPKFQEYMRTVVSDGFRAINDKVQVPEFFDDAMKLEAKLADPESWAGMKRALKLYDKFMNNVWKGYATASPGFIFRNGYTGFFNMWLDDVAPGSVLKFNRFLRQYHKDGFEAATQWAKKHGYNDNEIKNLHGALEAAAASGWGLTPQEVQTQLIGRKASFNPFSAEFGGTKFFRDKSSSLEALMRGAHAYDVLERGGDITHAISRVEKFHFNYRDITEFDRAAKRVSPFWTFYSRNMALQAEVWTRYPVKLNRSYFNLKRNLEINSDPDEVVPGYYEEMGAIGTPFGEPDGGKWYFTPDLPSLRFRGDLAQLTGADGGFSPLRMLSDASPALKIPAQLTANRNLFTDIPYKNRLYDYDSEGNIEGREAPGLLNGEIPFTDVKVPVVGDAVRQAVNLLPGTEIVGDELLMQDNTQGALEDLWPLLGRQTRLDPSQDKYADRQLQSLLSFIGVPARQNTERSIQGELYGRQIEAEKDAKNQAVLDWLRENVGG